MTGPEIDSHPQQDRLPLAMGRITLHRITLPNHKATAHLHRALAVLLPLQLLLLLLREIRMPRTEVTITTWPCGTPPWPNNNSSNSNSHKYQQVKAQVSNRQDHLGLYDHLFRLQEQEATALLHALPMTATMTVTVRFSINLVP